jgi:transglutaminase-like putative cysteine protease
MTNRTIHFFRVSLYAAICLATIGLWLGEDDPLPYPWIVALCVVAAYAFTDMWGLVTIPARLHVWLAIPVIAFFLREEYANYKISPVLPLGHLILLCQIILLFHAKTPRIYWLLLLTCFLQMLIAALHNNRLGFGIVMGTFLALIVWTMTQFLLLREAERHAGLISAKPTAPKLQRSVMGSAGSSLVIFIGAMLLFLVIPRRSQTAWTQGAQRAGQYLSGFDERIRLGQLGTILESDEEVMTIRLFDEKGQPYRPRDEPYWRGIALTYYEGGRWERRYDVDAVQLDWNVAPPHYVRQEIRLQGIHRDVLFGMWPAYRGHTRSGEVIGKIARDGSLIRPDSLPSGPLIYTVESVPNAPVYFRDELLARAEFGGRIDDLTQVPPDIANKLRDYAAQQISLSSQRPEEICESVLQHLQDTNIFDYSLRMSRTNPAVDPVLDFLINRKEGHCEYFASACALLLRAHNVPARVVNGFKGGDWNELFGPSLVVRQKHAHSWVEALVPGTNPNDPVWIMLDPTPGVGRQRVVSMVHPQTTFVRQVTDISRQIWSNYVLNFNSGEQEAAVYGPARRFLVEKGTELAARVRRAWLARPRGFNWRAAVASSLLMVTILFLLRWAARLLMASQWIRVEGNRSALVGRFGGFVDRLRTLLARWAAPRIPRRPRIAFYEELLRELKRGGFEKQSTWTAQQFAQHAETELEKNPQRMPAARIPIELVDRYYRVRFGDGSLSAAETDEVTRMLETLRTSMRR